jgi:hypothetical protein
VLIQEPAHTIFLLDKEAAAVGVVPKVLGLGQANRLSLQWIVHQAVAGAGATISLWTGNSDREADLTDLDPAANPYWSPLEDLAGAPITFPHLPGAVAGSCLLPIGPVSIFALLVLVTVAGNPYTTGSLSLIARVTG